MTTDPYRIAADAYCPHCGVKGRLVATAEDRYEDYDTYEVEMRSCVECGGIHESHGSLDGGHHKAMRIQFGRLIEGRPYEPPPPPARDPDRKSPDLSFMEQILKDYYGPHRDTLGPVSFADLCAPTQFKGPVRIDAKGATELKVSTWVMPSEEVAGIGVWIPSAPAKVDCGCHPDMCCHDCCEVKCGEGAED